MRAPAEQGWRCRARLRAAQAASQARGQAAPRACTARARAPPRLSAAARTARPEEARAGERGQEQVEQAKRGAEGARRPRAPGRQRQTVTSASEQRRAARRRARPRPRQQVSQLRPALCRQASGSSRQAPSCSSGSACGTVRARSDRAASADSLSATSLAAKQTTPASTRPSPSARKPTPALPPTRRWRTGLARGRRCVWKYCRCRRPYLAYLACRVRLAWFADRRLAACQTSRRRPAPAGTYPSAELAAEPRLETTCPS